MKTLTAKEANKYTTQLQGVGHVYGTPAFKLKIGSTILWNGGAKSTVQGIVKETKSFITFTLSDGERRFKKSRIVARPFNELPSYLQQRANYPKEYKEAKDVVEFFSIFPEDICGLDIELYNITFSYIQRKLKGISKEEYISVVKDNIDKILAFKETCYCAVCDKKLAVDDEAYIDEATDLPLCTNHSIFNEKTGNYKMYTDENSKESKS